MNSTPANRPPAPGWRQDRKGKLPLAVHLTRLVFRLLGPLLPGLFGRYAARLWFRTHRFTPPAGEARLEQRASEYSLTVNGQEIKAWYWGDGPAVLLMHGWNGRGMQLGNFVDPLLSAGYRVVAFDAPGHGQSAGNKTNIMEIRDVLLALDRREQGFHAAIGHSFGVACLAAANQAGMAIPTLVAISPPGGYASLVGRYCAAMRVPVVVQRHLERLLQDKLGEASWQLFKDGYPLRDDVQRALVVHDRDDHVVDYHVAEQLAADWPQAELRLTEGLGHRRILRHMKLVRDIVAYIDAAGIGDPLDQQQTGSIT